MVCMIPAERHRDRYQRRQVLERAENHGSNTAEN